MLGMNDKCPLESGFEDDPTKFRRILEEKQRALVLQIICRLLVICDRFISLVIFVTKVGQVVVKLKLEYF